MTSVYLCFSSPNPVAYRSKSTLGHTWTADFARRLPTGHF